jgi:hypothetical protein
MRIRVLMIAVGVALVCALGWAKGKAKGPDLAHRLMTLSDSVYYFPDQHGLKDLAVDLTVDELSLVPGAANARITFLYAGGDRQRFDIDNLPQSSEQTRGQLQTLLAPLSNFITPLPSASAFNGLQVTAAKVSRQIAGISDSQFYQLSGTTENEKATVKEYRVLLDMRGLAHQVENILKDGNVIAARVANIKIGDNWHISRVTTRLLNTRTNTPQWRIDAVEYASIEGFTLPVKATVQFRDTFNKPERGATDLTISFKNYRINKGVAAPLFGEPAK